MTGGAALGKDFTRVRKYKELLEDTGFVDVVVQQAQIPVRTWVAGKKMKTLGSWTRQDLLDGLQTISMAVKTRGLGMSDEEVEKNLADVRTEILSNKIHAYFLA